LNTLEGLLTEPTEAEGLFTNFYERHRDEVFRTAFLITTDREEARDLTQETFARAFQHWEVVSRHDRPGAWLQTVVTRQALSWRRRQVTRRRFYGEPEGHMPESDVTLEVVTALRRLTANQRAVLVLRFYADRSVDDVARTQGKRPGTIKALTSQAIVRIRPLLEVKGVRP
jgi:RNA polymerase sigma factor (sigma-70 family)